METSEILLVFAGLAGLMILSKLLFGGNRQRQQGIPPAAAAELQQAGRRMGVVAKQASMFAEAAMLLT
jgi:hypothetical protein